METGEWQEDPNAVIQDHPEVRLFAKWSLEEVQVSDISLTVAQRL